MITSLFKHIFVILFLLTSVASNARSSSTIQAKLAALEAASGGRIGVFAINTANDFSVAYRATERFPMGCTSKVIGVAAVLHQSISDRNLLSQKISFSQKDLTNWNPITEKHLSTGMTVLELCAAAISYSDNTAMNLLVKKMGGLKQMNDFADTLSNHTFRQDNDWPGEAYSGGKGNLKDSSTPMDMAMSLQKLVFSDVLANPEREMLISWLKANTTGDARIRAGVPKGWIVADKTGTGAIYGTTNDLAIVWPPKAPPIIMAIYYTSDDENAKKREDIVASVAHLFVDDFAKSHELTDHQA